MKENFDRRLLLIISAMAYDKLTINLLIIQSVRLVVGFRA